MRAAQVADRWPLAPQVSIMTWDIHVGGQGRQLFKVKWLHQLGENWLEG